jgi:hypothetical protein
MPSLPSIHLGIDAPDPELVSLPDPPRRERTWTVVVLALAASAALAMVFALRHDIMYALVRARVSSVGDLRAATSITLSTFENHLVHGEGTLGGVGGIRYQRLLSDDTFRAAPVAGRRDLWVEVRVPAGQESDRWEPPSSFTGRLVRFEAAGPRHRGLRAAIEQTTHEQLPSGAFLLVDGEDPRDALWVLVLAATFLGFAGWHAAVIARMLRKVS